MEYFWLLLLMDSWPIVILFVIAVMAGALWPFVLLVLALRWSMRLQAAIAEQQRLLSGNMLSGQDAQDALVAAIRQSAEAAAHLSHGRREVALHELQTTLARLGAGQSGHWSNGAYFERGNAVIPGGPALIDGKLFLP